MKLTRVALKDFRCFGEATFDLTKPVPMGGTPMPPGNGEPLDVVLLVGGNGSGKSAFIEAVSGLFSALRPTFGGAPLRRRDIRESASEASIDANWVDWNSAGDGTRAGFRAGMSIGPGLEKHLDLPADEWLLGIDLPQRPTGLVVAFDVYRLLPPKRVAGPNVERVAQHRSYGALAATIRASGAVYPRAHGLKQWIVNLDYLRAKTKADRGQGLPLWEVLHHALDTLLCPYTFEGVDSSFRVLFRTPSGRVPLEALSDGFRSTFTIVSDLLFRLNLATSHPEEVLQQEGVCLIDEVDAHLHPRWQETVIPGLRALFPNVQFIATTHSPIVVSSVEPENVFRLEAEDP